MIASKVRVHPQTLNNSLLSKSEKTQLRREKVVEYIRNRPIGTPMSNRELGEAAGYKPNQYNPAWVFLNQMVADGILAKERIIGSRKNRWTILTDAQTIQAPNGWVQQGSTTNITLTDLAKDFAWEQGSDSLREFIKWMDGQELEIRRQLSKQ